MTIAGIIEKEIEVPDKVQVTVDDGMISVTGPKGKIERSFDLRRIKVVQGKQGTYTVRCEYPRIRDKAMVGTITSHIKNMIHGVTDGYEYQMKIVFSHFPIKVSVKGDELVIENFLGERHPRKAMILGDTKVSVKGDELSLSGIDREQVGQTAANIEQATKVKGFDIRVFQDGIYITAKGRRNAR
ncbi:MAG TPA: 50S ribosomal protein L6 [Euryarchaeota archaeon]|nr:50S ribosomal protein L6 [Euryarchaeota archaeon]